MRPVLTAFALLAGIVARGAELPVYGGPGGSHFAADMQITPANVAALAPAWVYHTGDLERMNVAERAGASFQATPLPLPAAAGGSLVLCTPLSRVVALDPVTGVERWVFDPRVERGAQRPFNCRGVAYAAIPGADECPHRLFLAAYDRRLIALDAATGARCAGFGTHGEVDMMPADARHPRATVTHPSPPVVVDGVVVVGSGVVDFAQAHAPSGELLAYDAVSGALRWRFDPIPPVDVAGEWPVDARARSGAANAWAPLTGDAARGLVFVPTSSPSPDYWGADRPGDNRHANSLVALRARSGEVAWARQIVHHDLWDYDLPAQPILARIDGRDAVIQITKHGLVFMLDRDTGEPIWPVEERAVPQLALPGEQVSPTQPFPLRPTPLLPLRIGVEDAWGFTPWDRGRCRDAIGALRHEGLFTPIGERWTLMFPGSLGGPNWGGGALDEERGLLLVNFSVMPARARLVARGENEKGSVAIEGYEWRMVMEGTPWAMETGMLVSPFGVPCTRPPWGALAALDLASGEWRWRVPLGSVHEMGPFPLPFEIPLGTPNLGGGVATAAGLTFIAATTDRTLRAFDTRTGEVLWRGTLPADGMATPVVFSAAGRQFVVVAAGGHHMLGDRPKGDAVVAFALPSGYQR